MCRRTARRTFGIERLRPEQGSAITGGASDGFSTRVALEAGPEGLTPQEAELRQARFGPNRLPQVAKRTAIVRLALQFHNLLIYVLLGAAALAAVIGHIVDAVVVLGVVVINAIIGFIQEGRAEQALDAIRSMIDPHASVIRGGRRCIITAEDIVPGDLDLLEPGDRVARICVSPGHEICASTRRC